MIIVTTDPGAMVDRADGGNPGAAVEVGAKLTRMHLGWFGQPFPQGSAYAANSPIDVLVNGQSSEVLYAGRRGRISSELPASCRRRGEASLQLTAAWIPGAALAITTSNLSRTPCQGKVEMSYSQQSRNVLF